MSKSYEKIFHSECNDSIYGDIGTRTGKTFNNRQFFFYSRKPVCTLFFLQITSRQLYLASFVLWNDRNIFYNLPEDNKNV